MCGLGEFATTGSVGTAWGHAVSSKEVVRSALSIGYLSPGWPAEAFSNGIVTYIATLAPALQDFDHLPDQGISHGHDTPLPTAV